MTKKVYVCYVVLSPFTCPKKDVDIMHVFADEQMAKKWTSYHQAPILGYYKEMEVE